MPNHTILLNLHTNITQYSMGILLDIRTDLESVKFWKDGNEIFLAFPHNKTSLF